MTPPFGLRQFVQLGGHDVAGDAVIYQPGPGAMIRVQTRMPAVHEEQRGPAPRRKVVRRELIESGPRRIATAGVPVAGQVDQEERRTPVGFDAIEVGEPRLARGGARARQRLPDQGVNQARFADVGAADHGQLGEPFLGKAPRLGGAGHELRLDALQGLKTSSPQDPKTSVRNRVRRLADFRRVG